MIGYMWLGAWLLMLLVLGIIVISTGLPSDGTGEDASEVSIAWASKLFYLFLLAITLYKMGEHFGNL